MDEDNSTRSKATSPVNLEGGYQISKSARIVLDVFNLTNAKRGSHEAFVASMSARRNLMNACRLTPMRCASRSMAWSRSSGKSTFTRWTSCPRRTASHSQLEVYFEIYSRVWAGH